MVSKEKCEGQHLEYFLCPTPLKKYKFENIENVFFSPELDISIGKCGGQSLEYFTGQIQRKYKYFG